MKLPKIVTHKNMQPLLDALQNEPFFQCGNKSPYNPKAWYWKQVTLEVPTGELAKDGLTTIALAGYSNVETAPLTGKEGFDAQGLEGKAVIKKPLFNALMNLRDLIPLHRGRILI